MAETIRAVLEELVPMACGDWFRRKGSGELVTEMVPPAGGILR